MGTDTIFTMEAMATTTTPFSPNAVEIALFWEWFLASSSLLLVYVSLFSLFISKLTEKYARNCQLVSKKLYLQKNVKHIQFSNLNVIIKYLELMNIRGSI